MEFMAPKGKYGQCKCCLKHTYLRNMWEAHKNKEEIEVYGQMLVDCFSINWTIVSMEDDNICQVCISKLKVSNDFKKLVLESQAATLEAARVEDEPENNTVEEMVITQNDEHQFIKEVIMPKELITMPAKKVNSKTSLKEQAVTPLKEDLEKSSDDDSETSFDRTSDHVGLEKSECDSTDRNFEDVVFLEEDCLDDYGNDSDEEPKNKRKRTRNLQTRYQRTTYRNYLSEDMEKAVSAVTSGQMNKREAARVYNVPRESIAVKAVSNTADKHEGGTELGMPAQILQDNANTEVKQEVIEDEQQNNAKHTGLNNGDNSNIAAVENTYSISELIPIDDYKNEVQDLKEDNLSIPEVNMQENASQMQEFSVDDHLIHYTTDRDQIHVENQSGEQEMSLETHVLSTQNGILLSEEMPNYVSLEIEEQTVIPNNAATEDVLEMHKANILSVMAASNATPIRGHWGDGFACYYCLQRFQNPAYLKQHTYTHDNLLAIKVKSISDHVIKLDVTELKCNICNAKTDSFEDLMKHLKHDHGLAIYLDIPNHILPFDFSKDVLSCVQCFSQFESFKDLSDHMSDVHYRNYVCMQCNQGFVSLRTLKTHSIKHGITIFLCGQCPNYYFYKEDMADHENNHTVASKKTSENQSQYVAEQPNMDTQIGLKNACEENERRLTDREDNIEIKMPRNQATKEWNISVNETNLQYKCAICLKMFKSAAALSFHTNLSHQHKCHICKSVFDAKFDLQRHMRKSHPTRVYECPKCSQKFTSQKILEDHIAKHEFCCELCSTKFVNEDSYMMHMKIEHGLE